MRRTFTAKEKASVFEMWKNGTGFSEIANILGSKPGTIFTMLRDTGGIKPNERKRAVAHLKLITALSGPYSIKELCAVPGVHRSQYYYHRKQQNKGTAERDVLRQRATELHQMSRGSAGARTLSSLLRQEGLQAGRYKATRLMREAGLVSHQPGRHRYRVRDKASLIARNELARRFDVAEPNRVWCGDFTFIKTAKGWSYLAVVLDLYARKVVGWALSVIADSRLTQKALEMAWLSRGRPSGVLFHSDQGTQYSSQTYQHACRQYGIMQSMSRRGNCRDNSVAERLFRSLKSEWLPAKGYRGIEEARRDISFYLSGYYNRIRPHRHNNGLSPVETERQMQKKLCPCPKNIDHYTPVNCPCGRR